MSIKWTKAFRPNVKEVYEGFSRYFTEGALYAFQFEIVNDGDKFIAFVKYPEDGLNVLKKLAIKETLDEIKECCYNTLLDEIKKVKYLEQRDGTTC